ncbi:hypothetical protein PMM47T1_02444 [Pseudomonas sp. M47T1]|uniref:acyl-CoA dehydrogenase family protein n=1 Tax=unclassified Pseudomonas TaxID=196821 RepID=UPI0002607A86|nr:acyl-CoA dehydrogenase family protein [Pseudomonas sp. M47T1]EIK98088.1 hypothetical protein PMM47T1_02444 [Pseudomonas sp. M47T1]
MSWLKMLNVRERLPWAATLTDTYAALLERLGPVSPFDLAVLGGQAVHSPGLAFLVGYQAALRVLWPSAPPSLGAICATEQHSLRPSEMQTRLSDLRLTGRKDFVTAGDAADWLLVAARSEEPGQEPRLSLVVVYPGEAGVRLEPLPPIALMPEISHSRLHLDSALCERLAGDGWDAYVKPFRSLEDLYVLSAMLAWLYACGQDHAWPKSLQLRLLGLLGSCAEATRQCPDAAASHVLLAGIFEQFAALSADLEQAFEAGPEALASTWQRDRGLLTLASGARNKRLEKALQTLRL